MRRFKPLFKLTSTPVLKFVAASFLYARLKNGRIKLYTPRGRQSVRPSVNVSFSDISSYSLRPIELKLGI